MRLIQGLKRMTANIKKLSPKQRAELLAALKARFDANKARHPGLVWAKVQARLETRPDKLWSLAEMERTGGEPDVVALNPNGIPSLSPGLTRNAGLPWVIVPQNNFQPQRGCITRARRHCHAI